MLTLLVLYVDDVERSREFYSLLGIRFEQRGDGPVHYAAESRGGMVLELYPAGVHPVTRTRLGIEVADRAAAVAEAVRAGFRVRQSLVIDPDGNRVELRERATRTSKVDGARRKFGQFPDLDMPADFDTRRDDLVLMRAGDLEQQEEGIALASRLMRAAHSQGGIRSALSALDGWFALFNDDEQKECADEIDKLLWSAVELGSYRGLLAEYNAWRGTADAYATGLTATDGAGNVGGPRRSTAARPLKGSE